MERFHQQSEQTGASLNFELLNESDVKLWLGKLLKIDFFLALRKLGEALDELAWSDVHVDKRWELVEIFRAATYTLLVKLLQRKDVLTEEQFEVFEQCQHMIMSLQMINRSIVKAGKASLTGKDDLAARALHRAIADSSTVLLICYTRHQPVPESLWLEMHLLYKQARSMQLLDFSVEDKVVSRDRALSIEGIYKRSLLLSRSRHNQLSYGQIRLINRALSYWTDYLQLVSLKTIDACLVVDLESDVGLSYSTSLNNDDDKHLLILDASSVYKKILELQQQPKDKQNLLPERLLSHLKAAWSLSTERKHRRVQASGEVDICVGFEAVFYHLNGERTLEKYLNELNNSTDEIDRFSGDKHDVWSMASYAGRAFNQSADEPIEFNVLKKTISCVSHPITVCNIVNTCAGGYCLSTSGLNQNQLLPGELVALREKGRRDWILATVRWTQAKGLQKLEMGLELLAAGSKPCAIMPRRKNTDEHEYRHAFLLPEAPALNSEPTLITPRETFRGGLKFVLLYDDKVRKGQLLQCVSSSPGFSQFQYHSHAGVM